MHNLDGMDLVSFVIPAHNEEESLPVLLDEVRAAARDLGRPYEIVVVDDGSTDSTGAWLAEQAALGDDLEVVRLEPNRGQSGAMAAGFEAARGEVLVTLDADLQNDPKDTGLLLAALDGSADLACGVRSQRYDNFSKRIGSRIGNGFRRWVLGDRFRDVGCTLKAWRSPVAAAVPKFDGFHRFIPILAEAEGFRVVEVEVSHRQRRYGDTHYGNLGRAIKGLRHLFSVRRMLKQRRKEKAGAP